MTRIIAGAAGGRRLATPPGRDTRPTSDRVREAVFSRLEHEGLVQDAAVLDLYAGSGALGLEAASRGAARVTLVEQAQAVARVARANATALRLPDVPVDVVADSVERYLAAGPRGASYDLVLADPPYPLEEERLADVLATLVSGGWLAEEAVVVLERSSRSPEPAWPRGLYRYDERRYGETRLWFADTVDPGAA